MFPFWQTIQINKITWDTSLAYFKGHVWKKLCLQKKETFYREEDKNGGAVRSQQTAYHSNITKQTKKIHISHILHCTSARIQYCALTAQCLMIEIVIEI